MRKFSISCLFLVILLGSGAALAQDPAAITHGPMSGEVSESAVTLWARGGAVGTLTFEVADNADFSGDLITATVEIAESADLTGEVRIEDLAPATTYFYRVSLDGGAAKTGQFRTAPAPDDAAAFSFVFGACLGGQGYCRPPDTGWTIFDQMLGRQPDFFLLTGDTIYSGSACPTDENQNVAGAETPVSDLAGYRGRYRYHLEDPHYADFLARTPVFANWDDHEVMDNYAGPDMERLNPARVNEARQAFFEYWTVTGTPDQPYKLYRQIRYGAHAEFFMLDTRSYRDPVVNWDPSPVTGNPKTMLGAEQFAWLLQGLADSDATWKFIVSSVPLAYPTGFPQPQVDGRDGWANGADASGYETELMRLLFFIESHGIQNVIFLTGDAHWPYALSFDPDMDGNANFYEFSSSPLSAIPLAPAALDQTFNPSVLYAEGEFRGTLFNFGQVEIAQDGELTFRIIDREGGERFSVTLPPES